VLVALLARCFRSAILVRGTPTRVASCYIPARSRRAGILSTDYISGAEAERVARQ
jgi:hypothetical protein